MKKNYQQPNTIIIKVSMQSMIAATGLGLEGTTDKTSDLLSREKGWDDDDY